MVWLDASIDMNEDKIISQTKLRAIVNSFVTFHIIEDAIHFIQNIHREKVFLIISSALVWPLTNRTEMKNLSQLDSIYVFCRNQSKHRPLIKAEHKMRGVFTDIDRLCTRLKEDLKQASNDLLPISVAPGTIGRDQSMINKQKQEKQMTFLRAQLHRELLLTMEYSEDARLELVAFCKNIYADNQTERAFIEEFETDYHPSKSVWWYAEPSIFLPSTLLSHSQVYSTNISLQNAHYRSRSSRYCHAVQITFLHQRFVYTIRPIL